MKFEKTTQYRSEEGIVFNLSQITLMEATEVACASCTLAKRNAPITKSDSIVVDMYRPNAGSNLPCLLTVCISNPLIRQQADAITTMRGNVAKGIYHK